MAFADPQSITVNGSAKSMPRVSTKGSETIYQTGDETWALRISHQKLKNRVRSVARFDQKAIVANPLDSTDQDFDIQGVYLVIDRPMFGFSMTQLEQQIAGFVSWLSTANVDKLYGQET